MSLDGLRRTRGSLVTIKRATKTRTALGDKTLVWATVATDVAVTLQELTAAQAQRRFGRETSGLALAVFEAGQDVRGDDGLLVTAGPHLGTSWKVLAPRDVEGHHLEYGAERTTETFA